MFGLNDILLGGLVPLVAAAIAFAIGWATSRRPAVAWSAGVIIGYAAGVVALESRGVGLVAAFKSLAVPAEAKHWVPTLGALAVLPSIAAAATRRSSVRIILSVVLCATAPVWLLWGGAYLPTPEVRATGFANSAWSRAEAVTTLSLLALALFAAWQLWDRARETTAPTGRALLSVAALVAAAVTAGLTGSFIYAQLFGVLAAAVGGSALVALVIPAPGGPNTAAGPVIVMASCLLLLAACYSALGPWLAAGLYAAITISAGWLPGITRLRTLAQISVRIVLVAIPLTLVLWQAAADYLATQQQREEAAESNPYLNL